MSISADLADAIAERLLREEARLQPVFAACIRRPPESVMPVFKDVMQWIVKFCELSNFCYSTLFTAVRFLIRAMAHPDVHIPLPPAFEIRSHILLLGAGAILVAAKLEETVENEPSLREFVKVWLTTGRLPPSVPTSWEGAAAPIINLAEMNALFTTRPPAGTAPEAAARAAARHAQAFELWKESIIYCERMVLNLIHDDLRCVTPVSHADRFLDRAATTISATLTSHPMVPSVTPSGEDVFLPAPGASVPTAAQTEMILEKITEKTMQHLIVSNLDAHTLAARLPSEITAGCILAAAAARLPSIYRIGESCVSRISNTPPLNTWTPVDRSVLSSCPASAISAGSITRTFAEAAGAAAGTQVPGVTVLFHPGKPARPLALSPAISALFRAMEIPPASHLAVIQTARSLTTFMEEHTTEQPHSHNVIPTTADVSWIGRDALGRVALRQAPPPRPPPTKRPMTPPIPPNPKKKQ